MLRPIVPSRDRTTTDNVDTHVIIDPHLFRIRRKHKHPFYAINIARDGTRPKCTFCGLQTAFPNGPHHLQSEDCRRGRKLYQKRVQANRLRRQMVQVITIGGVPLGAVQMHQHLGRLLACNDNDWPAIQTQLKKARSRWGSLSRILVREGAIPRVSGMFYKAVVQAVLLHGCESWVLTDKVWKVLASFHNGAARCITRKMTYKVGEVWIYPPLEEAREDAGVHSIQHCVEKRQNRVAMHVASRPMWPHCVHADANPDSPTNTSNLVAVNFGGNLVPLCSHLNSPFADVLLIRLTPSCFAHLKKPTSAIEP